MEAERDLIEELTGPPLMPRDALLLCASGAQCIHDGDWENAEHIAKAALATDRTLHEAWAILGVSLAKRNMFALAAQAFGYARELRPHDLETLVALGECHLALLEYAAAADALKAAIAADPGARHPAGRRARALVGRTIAKLSR